MIPEFIGRFNCIVHSNLLKEEDLVRILTEPKNALIRQYAQLFLEENVKLSFSEGALTAIAKNAIKAGTGARALRMILENLLRDLMFEAPTDDSLSEVLIEEETILENKPPVLKRSNKKIA